MITTKTETFKFKNTSIIKANTEREYCFYKAGFYLARLNDNSFFEKALEHCINEYNSFVCKYGNDEWTNKWIFPISIDFSNEENDTRFVPAAFAVMYHMICMGYKVTWYSLKKGTVTLRIHKKL